MDTVRGLVGREIVVSPVCDETRGVVAVLLLAHRVNGSFSEEDRIMIHQVLTPLSRWIDPSDGPHSRTIMIHQVPTHEPFMDDG